MRVTADGKYDYSAKSVDIVLAYLLTDFDRVVLRQQVGLLFYYVRQNVFFNNEYARQFLSAGIVCFYAPGLISATLNSDFASCVDA